MLSALLAALAVLWVLSWLTVRLVRLIQSSARLSVLSWPPGGMGACPDLAPG